MPRNLIPHWNPFLLAKVLQSSYTTGWSHGTPAPARGACWDAHVVTSPPPRRSARRPRGRSRAWRSAPEELRPCPGGPEFLWPRQVPTIQCVSVFLLQPSIPQNQWKKADANLILECSFGIFWLFFLFFGLGCNFHCVLRSFLGFCSISTCFTVLEPCLFDSMYLACILLHVIVSLLNMLFES